MRFWPLPLLCAALLPDIAGAAWRDPTEPPAEVRAAAASASASAPGEAEAASPRHIIVANGRSYVVDRGRRLGVGELLGSSRIERIGSDAVWLRDGELVRRVPLYPGVSRQAVNAPPAAASAPRIDRNRPSKKDHP